MERQLEGIRVKQRRQLHLFRQKLDSKRSELRRDRERQLQRLRDKMRNNKYDPYHVIKPETFNPEEFIKSLRSGSLAIRSESPKSFSRETSSQRLNQSILGNRSEVVYRESSPGSRNYDRYMIDKIQRTMSKERISTAQGQRNLVTSSRERIGEKVYQHPGERLVETDRTGYMDAEWMESGNSSRREAKRQDNKNQQHKIKFGSPILRNPDNEFINYSKDSPVAGHSHPSPKDQIIQRHLMGRSREILTGGRDIHKDMSIKVGTLSSKKLGEADIVKDGWRDAIFVVPKQEKPLYLNRYTVAGEGPMFDPRTSNHKRESSRSLAKRSISKSASRSRSQSKENTPQRTVTSWKQENKDSSPSPKYPDEREESLKQDEPYKYASPSKGIGPSGTNYTQHKHIQVDTFPRNNQERERSTTPTVSKQTQTPLVTIHKSSVSPNQGIRGMSAEREVVQIPKKQGPTRPSKQSNPLITTLPVNSAIQSVTFSEVSHSMRGKSIVNALPLKVATLSQRESRPIKRLSDIHEAPLRQSNPVAGNNLPEQIPQLSVDELLHKHAENRPKVHFIPIKPIEHSVVTHDQHIPRQPNLRFVEDQQKMTSVFPLHHINNQAATPITTSPPTMDAYSPKQHSPSTPVEMDSGRYYPHVLHSRPLQDIRDSSQKEHSFGQASSNQESKRSSRAEGIIHIGPDTALPAKISSGGKGLLDEIERRLSEVHLKNVEEFERRLSNHSGLHVHLPIHEQGTSGKPQNNPNQNVTKEDYDVPLKEGDSLQQEKRKSAVDSKRQSKTSLDVHPKISEEEVKRVLLGVPGGVFMLRKADISSEEMLGEEDKEFNSTNEITPDGNNKKLQSRKSNASSEHVDPNVSPAEIQLGLSNIPKQNLFIMRKADVSSEELIHDYESNSIKLDMEAGKSTNSNRAQLQGHNSKAANDELKKSLQGSNNLVKYQANNPTLGDQVQKEGRGPSDRIECVAHPTIQGGIRQTEKVFYTAEEFSNPVSLKKQAEKQVIEPTGSSSNNLKIKDSVTSNNQRSENSKRSEKKPEAAYDSVTINPLPKGTSDKAMSSGSVKIDPDELNRVLEQVPRSNPFAMRKCDISSEDIIADDEYSVRSNQSTHRQIEPSKPNVESETIYAQGVTGDNNSKRRSVNLTTIDPQVDPEEIKRAMTVLPLRGGLLMPRKASISSEELLPEEASHMQAFSATMNEHDPLESPIARNKPDNSLVPEESFQLHLEEGKQGTNRVDRNTPLATTKSDKPSQEKLPHVAGYNNQNQLSIIDHKEQILSNGVSQNILGNPSTLSIDPGVHQKEVQEAMQNLPIKAGLLMYKKCDVSSEEMLGELESAPSHQAKVNGTSRRTSQMDPQQVTYIDNMHAESPVHKHKTTIQSDSKQL